jgi:hypothetical protein
MCLPPLVHYSTVDQYRNHFERTYCIGPVSTFDGIQVYFRKACFDHCMYESSQRDGNKDTFSQKRAERIDWIRETLTSPNAELHYGWDKKKKKPAKDRRVAILYEDHVVIIRCRRRRAGNLLLADFVTAFVADDSIGKIRSTPKWNG